jgi:hypothetical protein
MCAHTSILAPGQPLVAAASKIDAHSSLLAHLYQSELPGLSRNNGALSHHARTQTFHGCRTPAKNGERFGRNSKVRVIGRRDGRTPLIDKGLRELLHQKDNCPSFPMAEGMEVGQLAVTDGLHIVQDPAGTLATPVELVKGTVIRVGSLSVMSVVGRVS